jgi:hypothetical protein
MRIEFDKKKIKSKNKGWNWKKNSINKKMRKIKNNNKKNEDHIWYINQIANDEIEKELIQ